MTYAAYSIERGHWKATEKTPYLPSADSQMLLENDIFSVFPISKSHTNDFHWQNLNQITTGQ
jgi:hypothetical protein